MSQEEALFSGLRVLDVGSWIAGPVAATILADFGADVIKVEIPGAGDPYRRLSSFPNNPTAPNNYAWEMDARNKRSLTLNLKSEKGIEVLRRLVQDCDVYITNQPLPMRRSLNLTYDDLAPLNPRMIYASLTAYGESGPDMDREGFDLVAYWARSGLMDLVRAPGAPPAMSLPGMGDHPTAVALYGSIVTALLRREKTDKGSMVHTSLLGNGLWSASCVAAAAFAGGDFSAYRDARSSGNAPRALYECADGRWLQMTMVRTQEEFERFSTALGMPELVLEPAFATPGDRADNGPALSLRLAQVIASRPARQWLDIFERSGVPVNLASRIEELHADEQLQHAGALLPRTDNGFSAIINHPVHIDGLVTAGTGTAPAVGQHSREILLGLGYGDDEVDAMAAEHII